MNASLQYLPNRVDNNFDELNLTGGYKFSIVKDLLTANLSYSHVFFNQYSTQVNSEIKGVLTGEFSLDWELVSLGLNTTLNFGESTDVVIAPSVSHEFLFKKVLEGTVTVSLTFALSFSTQNLYALYKVRIGKLKKRNPRICKGRNRLFCF